MSRQKILLQLDTDVQASVFDAVVAVDAGVDQLFRHQHVAPEQVRDLVYGCMFTRSPKDLRNTAVFIGGSDVTAGEVLLREVCNSFFGPIRVSVMLDPNGSNSTASAAVLTAADHASLAGAKTLVLAATGPVGTRVTRLLARQGAEVRAASRNLVRAEAVCRNVSERIGDANVQACEIRTAEDLSVALDDVEVVICAGAAGIQLLSHDARRSASALKLAIDLNAVPPLGIEGIQATDAGNDYDGVVCYGAIGVGGRKMRIHSAAIERLFETNDLVLDAEEIYEIGASIG